MAGLNLAVKILGRPVGEGRAVKRRRVKGRTEENDQIIKAAHDGDIDRLVSMSHSGIDVTTARDWIQVTPMHKAAQKNHIEIIKLLKNSGATVDAKDTWNTYVMDSLDQLKEFRLLLTKCPDNKVQFGISIIQSGDTPLHYAALNGHTEAVAYLIGIGATVDITNSYQLTPMHRAALNNQIEVIKLLKNSGATVDAKDNSGDTPLHYAALIGHTEAVDYLIGIGATVDIRNNDQQTPMHRAARTNQIKIIKLLKNSGATVDAKDRNGDTPLHLAAYNGHTEAVDYLIGVGATVDITGRDGNTPLADAVEEGHGDIVNLLVHKYKADTSKVPQELQEEMKELLRKEAVLAADNKDVNRRDSQQDLHGKLQSPKHSINKRTVLAYQQAFKKGKKAANKFKIVVIGPEGAGKTSTVYSLLNKDFQQDQPSTIGADVNTCTADRFFTAKWKQVEIQHQLANLPIQLRRDLKSCMLNLPEETSELMPTQPVPSAKRKKLLQNHFQAEEIPHEVAVKVQEVVDAEQVQDDEIQITILDLGGQEVYYHIHFLFLAKEDVVFIAFNASKDLDEAVVCRQRLTRFQKKVEARGMQTSLQTIETLMQSVYSHCGKAVDGKVYISNRIPIIILIATHSKHLSTQEKAAIVFKIYEKFNGKPFMDHLPRSTKQAVFFVDNSARDPQVFEALKAVVLNAAAPTIAKECPISYLQFEVEILKESQSKAVISKQEAFAIAEKAGLQDTLMEVLHYHTLKGVLLYYPEVETLRDKVFISPQEVSNLVSSVISTHNCEPSSAKLQQVCHRYDQFGLLEEDLLDDMLHTINRSEDKNTILGFLQNFFLAVEVLRDTKFDEEKQSYTTPKGGKVFLIPSMLVYNSKVVPIAQKGDIILMYHFPDLFLPEHIFNEVLVKVVSWCNQHSHHVHSIFHGVGCFQFNGRTQSFKLHHCLSSCSIKCFITVHQCYLTNDVLDAMLLQRQHLRDHLEGCIEEAHQLYIPCARPPIGYLDCPLHSSEENVSPHIQLDQLTPTGDIICPKSIDCLVIPKEAYALLFIASLTSISQPVTKPTAISVGENAQFQITSPDTSTITVSTSITNTTNTSTAGNDIKDINMLDKVNFKAALDYTRHNYTRLIHLVISEDVVQNLFQERVITLNEKKAIQRKEKEKRMEYLLDEIIIPSIEAKTGQKYINLIKVMKSSDDTSLNAVAAELTYV